MNPLEIHELTGQRELKSPTVENKHNIDQRFPNFFFIVHDLLLDPQPAEKRRGKWKTFENSLRLPISRMQAVGTQLTNSYRGIEKGPREIDFSIFYNVTGRVRLVDAASWGSLSHAHAFVHDLGHVTIARAENICIQEVLTLNLWVWLMLSTTFKRKSHFSCYHIVKGWTEMVSSKVLPFVHNLCESICLAVLAII